MAAPTGILPVSWDEANGEDRKRRWVPWPDPNLRKFYTFRAAAFSNEARFSTYQLFCAGYGNNFLSAPETCAHEATSVGLAGNRWGSGQREP